MADYEDMHIIRIRLTPKAARNYIGDWVRNADGDPMLKVYVTAVPEDGKANSALINLLAKEWRLPKQSVEIIRGHTDRTKTIRVPGQFSVPDCRI